MPTGDLALPVRRVNEIHLAPFVSNARKEKSKEYRYSLFDVILMYRARSIVNLVSFRKKQGKL
jgi:hypothetical protein